MTAPSSTNSALSTGDGSLQLITWNLTTANPDGAPVSIPEWADRTWQATGTFSTAVLNLQGSNDGANWFNLSNAAGGAAISLMAPGGASTIELPLYVRPNLTTPGAAAAIIVTLLARRANPLRA